MRVLAAALLGSALLFTSVTFADSKAGDPRVHQQLKNAEIKYRVDKDGDFVVIYNLENDRTHAVYVMSETHTYGKLEKRTVLAPAFSLGNSDTLPGVVANHLLSLNSDTIIGAWGILKFSNGKVAVLSASIPADASAEELSYTLQALSTSADEIEQEFAGNDDY